MEKIDKQISEIKNNLYNLAYSESVTNNVKLQIHNLTNEGLMISF